MANISPFLGFPCGLAGKESACNVEDLRLIPGLGRSPGEGKGYPLHYSGLENSTVESSRESDTTEPISLSPFLPGCILEESHSQAGKNRHFLFHTLYHHPPSSDDLPAVSIDLACLHPWYTARQTQPITDMFPRSMRTDPLLRELARTPEDRLLRDFPGCPVMKNLPLNAEDMGSSPGTGTRIPHAAGQLSLPTMTKDASVKIPHAPSKTGRSQREISILKDRLLIKRTLDSFQG